MNTVPITFWKSNERAATTSPHWPWLLAPLLLLLVLAALRPLSVPDEGRYAEVSRWMLVSGDWLVPRLNGLPFFHKPPLTHWLQAASMAVFGASPWAARVPVVAHAALMLLGLTLAARRLAGAAVARRAALMLGSSLGFLIGGQYVNHDMGVATWIATAIWCFALALLHGERPHAWLARAGFAACALGVLTKGLIGLALPGLVLLLWIAATRQWRKLLRLPWLSGLAIFGLIAAPWFVLAGMRYPGFWDYLFGVQQFTRYTGSGFNNAQPWWFYLAAVALLLFPWSLLVLYRARPLAARTANAPDLISAEGRRLCWIWLVAIVLFFSIPRSKLIGYILPVMPPLALLAAVAWQETMARRRHAGRWFLVLAAVPVLLALVVSLALGPGRVQGHKQSGDVARTLGCLLQPGDTVYAVDGYPYDLPFVAQLRQPMVVIQDWPAERVGAGDSWKRELFEGADFEPATGARLLQTPDVLPAASRQPGAWLLAPRAFELEDLAAWRSVQVGGGWTLYASAPERPEAPQHEGLPGCDDQRQHQRQP